MAHKVFVVEYLTDKDNKKVYEKKVFDNFNHAIRFCKKLWKDKKYYIISMRDKKE